MDYKKELLVLLKQVNDEDAKFMRQLYVITKKYVTTKKHIKREQQNA